MQQNVDLPKRKEWDKTLVALNKRTGEKESEFST